MSPEPPPARTVPVAERRARLARRHRLLPEDRTDDVVRIADDLVALHATSPASVHLSALARMRHPSIAAVERALYDDRTLLRHHAMRRTLWVASRRQMQRMDTTCTRKVAATERRRTVGILADNAITDPEAWLERAREHVADALADGPVTTRELGRRVPELAVSLVLAPGTKWESRQNAHSRVLALFAFEGDLVRTRPAGWARSEFAWEVADRWVPGGVRGEGELDAAEAARDLAHTWLHAFGPASTRDLAWWTGWTLTMTRRALADCGAVPVTMEDAPEPGWLAPDDLEPVDADREWAAVLPTLDPATMGWKQRDWYLPADAAEAFDSVGNAGPTLWLDGVVVGSWAQAPDLGIRQHLFRRVPPARRRQLQERLDEVSDWIGETRLAEPFPPAIRAQLLAD